jgi:hypothetical protein
LAGTRGAGDFVVAFVTDEQGVVIVAGEPLGFVVHLGAQGARGIDHLETTRRPRLAAYTVGREHRDRALGCLVGLADEHRVGMGPPVSAGIGRRGECRWRPR